MELPRFFSTDVAFIISNVRHNCQATAGVWKSAYKV
jgi:hypothetical protein